MGQINQGRYDHLLRRTAGQVGPGSKVGEALEDLFPVLDVERAPMELLRACGWKFGMAGTVKAPTAGKKIGVGLFNPVGSGHLVVITSITFNPGTADNVLIGPIFAALPTTSVAGAERDLRSGAISPTVATIQSDADSTSSAFFRIQSVVNTQYVLADQNGLFVLAPGTGAQLSCNTADVTLTASFLWRERVALPEELNF